MARPLSHFRLKHYPTAGRCNAHFEIDHIISRNKGGTDHIDNLQLLRTSCNRIKGDRGMECKRTKQLSRLYHQPTSKESKMTETPDCPKARVKPTSYQPTKKVFWVNAAFQQIKVVEDKNI